MISRNVRADRVKYPETEAPEHGSTNCSGCDQHDTSAAAAFIFRVLGEISGPQAPGAMSWWTFSDVFQEHNISRVIREQGLVQTEFSSAYGLMTISGIRKPGWRAYELAHQSGDLKVDSVTSSEHGSSPFYAFATMDSSAPGLSSLMVWVSLWGNPYSRGPPHHNTPPHQITANRTVTINIVHDNNDTVPSTLWATRIDDEHANPQAAWRKMGSPPQPSAAQLQKLHEASELAPQPVPLGACLQGPACLNVTLGLSPNTAVLLSFKRPTSAHGGQALKLDDAPWMDRTLPVDKRVELLLSQMNNEEKNAQLAYGTTTSTGINASRAVDTILAVHGVGGIGCDLPAAQCPQLMRDINAGLKARMRLWIPPMQMCESTHSGGVSGTTLFPMPVNLGMSWNLSLMESVGRQQGLQARAGGCSQALSPVLQVITDPRFGRLAENFGECPHLVAEFGFAAMAGIQGRRNVGPDINASTYMHDPLNHPFCQAKHFAACPHPTPAQCRRRRRRNL